MGSPDTTLVLRVAYDGTGYSGFAPQEGQPHVKTIAGELVRALRILLRRDVELTCAGRTDAGVHALAQYASVPVGGDELDRLSPERFRRSMAAILPDDIRVTGTFVARAGFSARFDAVARRYRYRISFGEGEPLFCARWAWRLPAANLDVEAMRAASLSLIGEHDFKSFCKTASAIGKPTCRFVSSIDFSWEDALGERLLAMDIAGNAFLHSMVRTIMGTLVDVGLGRRPVEWVARVLGERDRRAAGQCAPARGLTFWGVEYPPESLVRW